MCILLWVSADWFCTSFRHNNILTAVRAHALLMGFARHFGNCGLAYLARTRTRPIVGRAAHINNARGDDVFIIIFFFNYRIIIVLAMVTVEICGKRAAANW